MGETLVEQTYQAIRKRIRDNEYRPSERLVEADLAEAFGVSRMTVRSALQRLHQEGLVTLEPNRGAKVRAISLEEAQEVMAIREVLEGLAAALAAERVTDEDLAHLEGLIGEMEAELQKGNLLEYSERNGAFHRYILKVSGNNRLQQMVDSLQSSLLRYRFRTILVPGRSSQSFQEHTAILAALRTRSPEAAERAMRHHLSHVRKTMSAARSLMEL